MRLGLWVHDGKIVENVGVGLCGDEISLEWIWAILDEILMGSHSKILEDVLENNLINIFENDWANILEKN